MRHRGALSADELAVVVPEIEGLDGPRAHHIVYLEAGQCIQLVFERGHQRVYAAR